MASTTGGAALGLLGLAAGKGRACPASLRGQRRRGASGGFAATSSRPLFRCQLLFGSLPLTLGIAYGHQSSEWCCGVTGQHFVELSKSEKGFTLSRQLDLLYLSWVSFCLLAAMGGTVMCSGSRTAGVLTIPKNAGSLWPGMGRAPSRHAELAPGSEVSPCPWE